MRCLSKRGAEDVMNEMWSYLQQLLQMNSRKLKTAILFENKSINYRALTFEWYSSFDKLALLKC